jgi:hypothetical protein
VVKASGVPFDAKRVAECDDRLHAECEFFRVVLCSFRVDDEGAMKSILREWVKAVDSEVVACCAAVGLSPTDFCLFWFSREWIKDLAGDYEAGPFSGLSESRHAGYRSWRREG